jgi:hypothetical protein
MRLRHVGGRGTWTARFPPPLESENPSSPVSCGHLLGEAEKAHAAQERWVGGSSERARGGIRASLDVARDSGDVWC